MKQTDTSRSRETELKENRVYGFSTKEFEKGMKKAIGNNAIGYIKGIAEGKQAEQERILKIIKNWWGIAYEGLISKIKELGK